MHSLVDISFLRSRVYTANGAEQGSLLNRRQLNCAKCNNALYVRTNALCIWFYSSEFRFNENTEREGERETQANETDVGALLLNSHHMLECILNTIWNSSRKRTNSEPRQGRAAGRAEHFNLFWWKSDLLCWWLALVGVGDDKTVHIPSVCHAIVYHSFDSSTPNTMYYVAWVEFFALLPSIPFCNQKKMKKKTISRFRSLQPCVASLPSNRVFSFHFCYLRWEHLEIGA